MKHQIGIITFVALTMPALAVAETADKVMMTCIDLLSSAAETSAEPERTKLHDREGLYVKALQGLNNGLLPAAMMPESALPLTIEDCNINLVWKP